MFQVPTKPVGHNFIALPKQKPYRCSSIPSACPTLTTNPFPPQISRFLSMTALCLKARGVNYLPISTLVKYLLQNKQNSLSFSFQQKSDGKRDGLKYDRRFGQFLALVVCLAVLFV
jgi:hypothetical protein